MKCINPEIAWHNREPVFSVDIQQQPISISDNETVYRLASGGGDYHVVVWHIKVKSDGLATFENAADLNRHQKAVNVVRFAPSGELLASGDDEGVIMVWRLKAGSGATSEQLFDEVSGCENWVVAKVLRGHLGDVYDLCWSPDSKYIISGSIDNKAILWNAALGKYEHIFQDHKGFVQGVAWDPKNKYYATLSSDRFCRIFRTSDKKPIAAALKAETLPTDNIKPEENDKSVYLFHDDTFKSFFRRLTFSPDGNLVIAPSGIFKEKQEEEPPVEEDDDVVCDTPKAKPKRKPKFAGAVHLFSRYSLKKPCLSVPLGPDKYCVAVRCCPVLFEHSTQQHGEKENSTQQPMVTLPYRMVFAVATQDSVLLFDTNQLVPIGKVTAIHYTGITDLTWSSDGRVLLVCSTDGYCSIVTFKPGELGVPVKNTEVSVDTHAVKQAISGDIGTSVSVPKDAAVRSIQIQETMPDTKTASSCIVLDEETEDLKLVLEDTVDNTQQMTDKISSTPVKGSSEKNIGDALSNPILKSPKLRSDSASPLKGTGRRVQLITLSSPKKKKA